ncbi:MAG: TatD family hydrolase [Candidatus Omnitrophica bacterium]|nr:TatD family hydrolase [Candidatus Omnitrophota bacterium]
MKLFDTHVHLNQIEDIDGALKRAKEAGVDKILIAGLNLESNRRIIELYNAHKEYNLYPALGIHPFLPEEKTLEEVCALIKSHRDDIAAVGEIGLDYWYKEARKKGEGRDLQRELFTAQLELAGELDKPVIIHSRGAWSDCLSLVREYQLKQVLFHWYTGPVDILKEILNEGFYISLSPSLEYSKDAQAAAKEAPLERILLETDSPVSYKSPGGRYVSEPKDAVRVLKKLSELKEVDEEKVAGIIYKASCTFFNIVE